MKIALVHEFLTQFGGAERVLQSLLEIWPEATVHVLVHNPDKINHVFDRYNVKTSFVNQLPFAKKDHKWYLALMPFAIESFDLHEYDIVFSDSSSFAKGVKSKGKYHICYCHTPTRFLWTEQEDYLQSQPYPFFVKWIARPVLSWMKKWDYKAAQRPDFFIANSANVRNRIKKYYNRDSEVIPPPVDTEFFHPVSEKKDYYFTASRLEPYKKIELVIEAFNELGWPLVVAGSGTKAEKLKALAKPNIKFIGRVSDEDLRKHYSEAKAFVFPAEEDAGIMVLEAQACGTPVIAYGAGGSLETVIEGQTGTFFDRQTKDSLKNTLLHYDTSMYRSEEVRGNALKYDKKEFQRKIKEFVNTKISK